MGLSITGYVLDPPRVGTANSPFTLTPNNLISDQVSFDAAYPSNESAPRTEYLVQVLEESFTGPTGPSGNVSLPDARFGWTKNEGVFQQGVQVPFQRFDYSGQGQRFKTLQGAPRENLGVLASDSNTTRLTASAPVILNLVSFPIRLAVGGTGSGTTFAVTLVVSDGAFGAPALGTVELSLTTGSLNWNPGDLVSFLGQPVYFQRQSFYFPTETTGAIGTVGSNLLLNPLPITGQRPLLSFGSRTYLAVNEVANDGALGSPPSGTVQWSRSTGLLRFNAADSVTYAGQPVLYDGVLAGTFQVPVTVYPSLGAPAVVSPLPPEDSDVFFRISGVVQFATVKFVDSLATPGKSGEVQIERGTGSIQFSSADVATYGGQPYEYINPDVLIERGIKLRLFRSPVDLNNLDSSTKDVTCLYTKSGLEAASLADPMIGQPLVFLPALPLLDKPLDVRIDQGSGSFTGPLNRLDTVPSPGAGKGYLIDFEAKRLLYGERKVNVVLDAGQNDYGALQLPNFPVFAAGLLLEQETAPGSGTYIPLVLNNDYNLDTGSGVVTFSVTDGTLVIESSGGFISAASTLIDTSVNMVTLGVVPGDYLIVTAGLNKGVYTVATVGLTSVTVAETFPAFPATPIQYEIRRGAEVLVDRYWREVPTLDPNTPVTRVIGLVSTVLILGKDYEIQPGTGFIEFTDRMLADEEVQISYATFEDAGNKVLVNEAGVFLVSKEVVQPHPADTSTLFFNSAGKNVAADPSPKAWRGGRPQVTGEQVIFDTVSSTATFLADDQYTDALPHGASVSPSENVYVDYYVYGALGGEKNLTVLRPPMASVQVVIEEGSTTFTIEGNRLADFPANYLLRVDGQDVYLLSAPMFDGTKTFVNLDQSIPQTFKADFNNPTLETTSGETRRVPSGLSPSYFIPESTGYDPSPRGAHVIRISGDHSRVYPGGTVILFSDGLTFQDYASVEGSVYDADGDKTQITLSGGTQSQYGAPVALYRSIRPILATPSAQANTSRSPVPGSEVRVFRRVLGQAGVLLTSGVDYVLDESGRIQLAEPLQPEEEVGILYTGYQFVTGGTRHRATWNFVVVPTVENGMLNQILKMQYTTYSPDTFFWRVESMTNFRGEMAKQFASEAKASSPSQGPILENTAGQVLFEKGSKSLFYNEGLYANQDLVARPTLSFYNSAVNYLEEYLKQSDGRIVGDQDGPFLFDGLITNPVRASFDQATNQIDDLIQVAPGLVRKAYWAAAYSRFFPTSRRTTGEVISTPTDSGDIVYDTGYTPLSNIDSPTKRFPFARITKHLSFASTGLTVDEANGGAEFFRPPFTPGMVVQILAQDGTMLDNTGKTVLSVVDNSPADDTVVLSGGVITDIPAGSTLRLAPTDTNYPEGYAVGVTVYPVLNDGLVAYVKTGSFLPFVSPPPAPQGGDYWDVLVGTIWAEPEPFRFPALDGGTVDDDNGISTEPLLGPLALSELAQNNGTGLLSQELDLITEVLGATATPVPLTGSLDLAGTALTLLSGTFAVTPRVGDLVRITTGLNAGTSWVRVTAGTATTATLEAFYAQDSGFTFYITNSISINSGSGATVSVSGTTFTNTAANFIGVQPGQTVVVTSGSNIRQRRNVVSVDSPTQITLSSAFTTSVTSSFGYRIDTYLGTFGQTSTSSLTRWLQGLTALGPVYTTEALALEGYINTVGQDIVSSVNGNTTGLSTLVDTSVNFSSVSLTDLVFVRLGANFGFYSISGIAPTVLTVSPSFPSGGSGLSYRVIRVTGASAAGLANIQSALGHADTAQAQRVQVLASYAVGSVVNDPGAFAHNLLDSMLTSRSAQVTARLAQVAQDIAGIGAVLSSIDRLYDVRFVWIDGRINLESGILVKQERAVAQRQKALAQIVKNMTKLLTTQ